MDKPDFSRGPLAGYRVIDASSVVAGPLGAMALADQGADVIKLEPPGVGDLSRQAINERDGMAGLYLNCNRGKRSIVVDVKQEAGLALAHELIRGADVFISNWRPGAAERLGLGEEQLRALHPDLVNVQVTGFGRTGPYSEDRVYDPVLQALAGYVALQENPEFPIRDLVRNVEVDKATAWTVAQATTSALLARERGAGGQHVHVSMLDVALSFFWPDGMITRSLLGEGVRRKLMIADTYRVWMTQDGQVVYFTNTTEDVYNLFAALGHPEWKDEEQFSRGRVGSEESRAEIGQRVLDGFASLTTDQVVTKLRAHGVPVAPVHEIDDVCDDPQIRHNGKVNERAHPTYGAFREVRPAAEFAGTPPADAAPPALRGEHSEEILAEMGHTPESIAELIERGVVGTPERRI